MPDSDLDGVIDLERPTSGGTECAVIYVGPTSISLLVGVCGDSAAEPVDYLDRPLPLARDIFRTGTISRQTMEQAAGILRDYLLAVEEYQVPRKRVMLYNTNILAEASNHEIFLNRLQVTTGLQARLIDDGDMTRLIYQIALRLLKKQNLLREAPTFVTHIGPGNTRALYFRDGRLRAYSNYRLGIFRAHEAVAAGESDAADHRAHLEQHISGVVDHLAQDYSWAEVMHHVAIGAELQSVAPRLGAARQGAIRVSESDLARLAERLSMLSPDALVRELHLHYSGSEGVVPALQTNLALARRFGDEQIWVPEGDFQRELLVDLMTGRPLADTFREEVMQSAHDIGAKYKTDRKHAEHVTGLAQQLFRELQHLHGLDPRYELLLRVAATLHEVGMFISPREHHKHSLYILMNTEIFGLSSAERTLVALLARYHRRYNPESKHPHFADLSRAERMVMFKLAALLRVADALDRSHSQRIQCIQLRLEPGMLYILTPGVDDTTVEQLAINSKCDLFREIYGYEILLTQP
ncbi:MAG: HD domain-containing protein [Verrucomicrobiales bacterium]|nr:HD domain-containing protein [Verrucomicrobiales bacterium]